MKRIVYDYLFNYLGGDTHKGKIVTGAVISVNIRAYKGSKEILFEDEKEPNANGHYLFEVFDLAFDRENGFKVTRNLRVDNLFRLLFGWDSIEYEVVSYSLDVFSCFAMDIKPFKDIPELKNLPVSEPVTVTKRQFKKFLDTHKDDFDISDNIHAQVPSVAFVDKIDNVWGTEKQKTVPDYKGVI